MQGLWVGRGQEFWVMPQFGALEAGPNPELLVGHGRTVVQAKCAHACR